MKTPSADQLFGAVLEQNRQKAAALGVRVREVKIEDALKNAKRTLSGSRLSDGFTQLVEMGQGKLTLEALAVDKRFTELFTDEEANEALMRLLSAGYKF